VILGTKLKGDLTLGMMGGKDLVVDVTNRTARVMVSKDDHAVPDYKRFLVEDGKRRKYANLC
jgi:hypothetical protein